MKKIFYTLFLASFFTSTLLATHNRAGEISFEAIGQFTYRATIHTYTKASSVPADRDSLQICWGDGTCEWVLRSNGNGLGVLLLSDIRYNQYTTLHTYSGFGEYMLSMSDPNRNGGILNINSPSSDNVQFHIETKLMVVPETNNSPILLAPPIDIAFVGHSFHHSPNAFDPDGDSIAYELITPFHANGQEVANYLFPNEIQPGPENTLELDEVTGELTWNSPQQVGEYAIAILIKEYRNGVLISSTVRDMQILVNLMSIIRPSINMTAPPQVVQSGSNIDFDIIVNDADNAVLLSASGGPFEVDNPAVLTAPAGFQNGPFTANFRWETQSSHERDAPYQVVLQAKDEQGAFVLSIFQVTIGSTNSTIDVAPKGQIQLYPNPASEKVWVQWKDRKLVGTLNISVYNLQGSLILEKSIDNLENPTEIDLSNMPDGPYWITLSDNEVQISQQLIKG